MDKLKEIFVPSLIASGVSLVLYKVVLNENLGEQIPVMDSVYPAYLVLGGTAFLGNVAGEFLSDVVIPKIPKIEALGSIQDAIVPPSITGLSTYGVMRFAISEDTSFKHSFLLGAGSSVIGKYIYGM